jgi:hypothetical protein
MIAGMSAAYREHVERAVINWLETMTHTPSCGYEIKGDLVRWQVIDGHRLPTVRDDLVASAVARNVVTSEGELVSVLADKLEPQTREMLAFSLSALQ